MNNQRSFHSPIKKKILLLLQAGVALGLVYNPRRQLYILTSIPKELKKIHRYDLYRKLHEFNRDRLVFYQEKSNGEIRVVLTEAGKKRALKFNIDNLVVKQPNHWDGKWRVVIFDVPERYRRGRDAFRFKLKELGFYEWQKSVFVHPFSCRDEIDFIVEFFDLRSYVRYAELSNPTNEAELKLHFDL